MTRPQIFLGVASVAIFWAVFVFIPELRLGLSLSEWSRMPVVWLGTGLAFCVGVMAEVW